MLYKMSKQKRTTTRAWQSSKLGFSAIADQKPLQISCMFLSHAYYVICEPDLRNSQLLSFLTAPMAKLVLPLPLYCFFSFLLLSTLYTDFPTFVESIAPWPTPAPNNEPQRPPRVPPPAPSIWPPPQPMKGEPKSSGGLNGGQKAGIAIGVLAGTGLIVFGGLVYKKRRHNIRRSRFGYAARNTILWLWYLFIYFLFVTAWEIADRHGWWICTLVFFYFFVAVFILVEVRNNICVICLI